jgi:hypothetical protein
VTICPFTNTCWLGGAYNYCKTSNCKEPLLPRDKPMNESVKANTRKGIEATKSGLATNDNDGREGTTIQGELF